MQTFRFFIVIIFFLCFLLSFLFCASGLEPPVHKTYTANRMYTASMYASVFCVSLYIYYVLCEDLSCFFIVLLLHVLWCTVHTAPVFQTIGFVVLFQLLLRFFCSRPTTEPTALQLSIFSFKNRFDPVFWRNIHIFPFAYWTTQHTFRIFQNKSSHRTGKKLTIRNGDMRSSFLNHVSFPKWRFSCIILLRRIWNKCFQLLLCAIRNKHTYAVRTFVETHKMHFMMQNQ